MFDIAELDHELVQVLDLNSLTKCALISRLWNKSVTPYLWKTIPKGLSHAQMTSLCIMVLEDFLHEHRRLEQQLPPSRKKARPPVQTGAPANLALTKNGALILHIECAAEFLLNLEQVFLNNRGAPNKAGRPEGPSIIQLVLHFLQRSPNVWLDFEMNSQLFNVVYRNRLPLALTILPRVNCLSIKDDHDRRKAIPLSKFKQALAAASELSMLTLAIHKFKPEKHSDVDSYSFDNTPDPTVTARPKRLHLWTLLDPACCSWLWPACGDVQELELCRLSIHVFERVVGAIQNSMPLLIKVAFSEIQATEDDHHLDDQRTARILAAGTKGWQAVHFGMVSTLGLGALDSLLQHTSTLEEFSVISAQVSANITQILKSCPKLTFFHAAREFVKIEGATFIDWDEGSDSLHPWACCETLETLAINIFDIPHKDPLARDAQNEDKTQKRVCERLGTFTSLKTLQLAPRAHQIRERDEDQEESLHLTLETGLDKMDGLKKLEELYIGNMDHRVGLQEAKWMVEQWPKLRKLSGLNASSEAFCWLRSSRHKIMLND
ncbi:hypothetical protein BGZ82_002696 [Podila clonocystis]|nr:hypothetical protein BGZ82_002696 [Podila clonocystis]